MRTSNKLLILFVIFSISHTNYKYYRASKNNPRVEKRESKRKYSRKVRTAFYKSQNSRIDTDKWNNFINEANIYISKTPLEVELLNNMAWYVFENYKNHDTSSLESAKIWSEKTIEINPNNAHHLDTYACILFDLGYVDEAVTHQEKAVKILKSTNHKWTKDYQKRLDKFRAKLY